jgi:hypothetical protein
MGEVKPTNTPYADVFRTLLNDCTDLIIPMINEVFQEDYSGEEEIIFGPNEHYENQQDGNEEERITDTSFKIIGKEIKKYHIECQSSTDDSMLIRIFEYDAQIALDQGKIQEGVLTVVFPHSAILFLRCSKSTPDRMKISIVTPGGSITYGIPVIKSQQYTIEDIFQKKLLFFIPFYIFSHEKRFVEYERDSKRLELLKREYEDIKERLENLLIQGIISEYTKCTIVDMSNKVLGNIAKRYDSVREGVKSVMGGKVLEYEAKIIRKEGLADGRKEGRVLTVRIFQELKKNPDSTFEQIAERVGCEIKEVEDTLAMYEMN